MNKKLVLIFALTVVMVLGSVTMAYAAANSGYAPWDNTIVGNGTTPHKNFSTTTVKCAVCHAVHKGTNGGELLLMGTAGSSCEYCHISDNIGLVRLYAGVATNYTNPSDEAHTDNAAGANVGSRCTDCHSIHGANTLTNALVDKFILKSTASASGAPGGQSAQQAAATAVAVANPLSKEAQIDAFCSMCHPYYQPAYNGTISVAAYHAGGTVQSGTFQSHVMSDSSGDLTDYLGNAQSTYKGQVAWYQSSHCRDCHDAGVTDQQGLPANQPPTLPGDVITESYPHYTPSYTRFLISKSFEADGDGNTAYEPAVDGTSPNMPDGVCLKCHRGTSATDGVGDDF